MGLTRLTMKSNGPQSSILSLIHPIRTNLFLGPLNPFQSMVLGRPNPNTFTPSLCHILKPKEKGPLAARVYVGSRFWGSGFRGRGP